MPAQDQFDAQSQIAISPTTFSYTPLEGQPRSVTGAMQRQRVMQHSDGALFATRIARVLVMRDPLDSLGGIDDPQLGDELQLAGETDVFRFTGQVLDENDYAWKLEFECSRNERFGGNVER